ncbi:unnamed protein product [Miscanthus lutarioriparius]|uniref:Uncharacterized protein n=1 Tax=Miscanthus lutarioriparius TaxID=422564 RepID=A0A811PLT6_9POAL|nr:unnamed protein product [Miscanthus lutarioriparius]
MTTAGAETCFESVCVAEDGGTVEMVLTLLPEIIMLMLRQRRPIEHLVGEVLMALSSVLEIADAGVGSGMTVIASCTMVDVAVVEEDVGAVGPRDRALVDGTERRGGGGSGRWKQSSRCRPGGRCSGGFGWRIDGTEHGGGGGVGAAVRAGVDGGAATTGAAVGVEDAGEVGEDEGVDDRVADARVLRVLHIPAFASSIISNRRCICASSPTMAETDSVDPALPRHLVADPHDLDEHGDFLDRWLRYQMSRSWITKGFAGEHARRRARWCRLKQRS